MEILELGVVKKQKNVQSQTVVKEKINIENIKLENKIKGVFLLFLFFYLFL
jgi:hypothetical protein